MQFNSQSQCLPTMWLSETGNILLEIGFNDSPIQIYVYHLNYWIKEQKSGEET